MPIEQINYSTKSTGGAGVSGQVTADDLNQIKIKANAGIAVLNSLLAMFDLDGNGLPIRVKNSALPDVNIFDKFGSDFVVSDGVIKLAGSSALPQASPLTNPVMDDTANTFTGTIPGAYTIADVERSLDGGSTWALAGSLPISVGNVALAVGLVKLRIKATSSRSASLAIQNAAAFTVAGGGGGNADDGFTKLIADGDDNLQRMVQRSSPDNNSYDSNFTAANQYAYLNFITPKIPAGGVATFRWNPAFVGTTPYSMLFGISTNESYSGKNGTLRWISYQKVSSSSAKITTIDNGNYTEVLVSNLTVPVRLQIRTTGTRIYGEYSVDGGVSWIDIAPGINLAQPNQVLYAGGYGEGSGTADNVSIVNVLQKGLS